MGMYFSGILTILSFPLRGELLTPLFSILIGLLLLLPGGVDGTTQMFGERESNNTLRIITGVLLGLGVVLFAEGILFAFLNFI